MSAAVAAIGEVFPTLVQGEAPRARLRSSARRLDQLAWLLDDAIPIPGTSWRMGADVIVGLIPGVGPVVAGIVQAYVVFEALRLGVARAVVGRLLFNVLVDTIIGGVPIVGSLFDLYFKATRRNVALLREAMPAVPIVR